MSKLTLCDVCHCIIKEGDKKFVLGLNAVQHQEEDTHPVEDFADFINRYKRGGFQKVDIYEICDECKKILEHLFRLRKKERRDMLAQIKKMYQPEVNGNTNEEEKKQ